MRNRSSRRVVVSFSLAVFVALVAIPASGLAAPSGNMRIEGITGGATERGREGTIEVIEPRHSVTAAVDSSTGTRAGAVRHTPITIVKQIDRSSPTLLRACSTGQHFPTVTIRLYEARSGGSEVNYYTITLQNVIITGVSTRLSNTVDASTRALPAVEEVTLQYASISFEHEPTNTTAELSTRTQ